MKDINYLNFSYGINQPYFLPYIGYFSLIKETDRWIVFDDIQYVKQSWGNRNKILKHPSGVSWINIPIKKHSRASLYSEIEIQNNSDWKQKLIRQFEYYKINAPYYKTVVKLFEDIIAPDFEYLVDLNINGLEIICDYLNIPFSFTKYSDLNLKITNVKSSGDWALQICKNLDIRTYINPYKGYFMFETKDWDNENIKLQFLKNKNLMYAQKRVSFEERLSIIDVLMWNSIEEVHKLMESDIYEANEFIRLMKEEDSHLNLKYNDK